MFDPNTFIDLTIEGKLSTKYTLVPEGEWIGVAGEVTKDNFREINLDDGPRRVFELTWEFNDPEVVNITKRKRNYARQTVWLELNDDGSLDRSEGANVPLGQLREAVGQNGPGSWNFRQLQGVSARCVVKHTTSKDGSRTYANVVSVAAL